MVDVRSGVDVRKWVVIEMNVVHENVTGERKWDLMLRLLEISKAN